MQKIFYRVCNPHTEQGLWYHFNGVKLKDLIKKLDIPFLKRKWDKFNNKI